MENKLDSDLTEALAAADDAAMDRSVPVIVTLRSGTDASAFQADGLTIRNAFSNISAVAGSIRLRDLNALAAREDVEMVEFDGEMHATD